MLKKYKNQLLDAIKKNGVNVNDVKIEENMGADKLDVIISFKKSPLYYSIRQHPTDFHHFYSQYVSFAPGYPLENWTGIHDFNQITNDFLNWYKLHLKEYIDEQHLPDLWKQLEEQKPIFSTDTISQDDTDDFTDDEKAQIRMQINEFKLLVKKNFSPSEEELKIIDDRFNYISDALDRLNKFDWRALVFSTLMSVSVALSLDTTKGKLLFDLFRDVFIKVFYLTQL